MSNDSGMNIWVSDLDGYINIDAINRENAEENRILALENDLDELGEILLFSDKSISVRSLNERGISPQEWRWAVHESENALHDHQDWGYLEADFIKDLLNLGRRYAVARYASWEGIYYQTALTATFKHGFRALLDQFLIAEKVFEADDQRRNIHSSVRLANAETHLTAYHRTAIVQSAIHRSADDAAPSGHLLLDKGRMRNILSLARLHYCVDEIKGQSLSKLNKLDHMYENARLLAQSGGECASPVGAQKIQNWELRHLHPLIFLYPYSIRHSLRRAKDHFTATNIRTSRSIVVNELSLARCGILLMRKNANTSGFDRSK